MLVIALSISINGTVVSAMPFWTYFQNNNGIRDAIIALKKRVYEERGNGMPGHNIKEEPVILIKPDTSSQYDDIVNILDEMNINGITTYALVDITEVDRDFIKKTETLR